MDYWEVVGILGAWAGLALAVWAGSWIGGGFSDLSKRVHPAFLVAALVACLAAAIVLFPIAFLNMRPHFG